MKCPKCGSEMLFLGHGRYECRDPECEVIEVRHWDTRHGSYRRGKARIIYESRHEK